MLAALLWLLLLFAAALQVGVFLNRLSDYLFVAARYMVSGAHPHVKSVVCCCPQQQDVAAEFSGQCHGSPSIF